jgi:hypothetical protein
MIFEIIKSLPFQARRGETVSKQIPAKPVETAQR